MEDGNEATNRSGVTQFAEGEPTKLPLSSCSPNGECVIPFAVGELHYRLSSLVPWVKTHGY